MDILEQTLETRLVYKSTGELSIAPFTRDVPNFRCT